MKCLERCLALAVAAAALVAPAAAHAGESMTTESAKHPAGMEGTAPEPDTAGGPDATRPLSAVRGLASGGASMASLFDVSSTAVHVDAGVGFEHRRLFVPVFVDAELGKTRGGLGVGEVTLSVGFQGILGRIRLGGGAAGGYGWLSRATSTATIGMFGLDAFALATVDLIDFGDRRAIYLGVKPSVGVRWGETFFAWGHGTLAWRGAAMAGVRF